MPNRNEKTARNRAIVEAWLAKTPYTQVMAQYGVSHDRVNKIVRMYKIRALRQAKRSISAYAHGERGRKML